MSKEEKPSLQELVDLNELQSIQDSFAKTVGTSSVILSPEGGALTQFSNPTRFCSLIQSTEEGRRRCFQSFMEMSRKALELKEPKILYCFAHGGHFVAPIIIGGEHKGTMFAGQFIPHKFSDEQLTEIKRIAEETNIEPELLVKEAKRMRVVDEEDVWNYSNLLFQIVEVIARLGTQAGELNHAKNKLQKAHDELEMRVQERTVELAKTTEDLRREKERAEEYLNIAGVMLAILDAGENITLINKKGCEILGYKEEELIGRNWFDTLVPQRIRGEIRGVFGKLMAGDIEPVEYYENPVLTKDGEERLIAFHNTVIRDQNGQIEGVLFSGEDITERKQAEEERGRLLQELRDKNTELERFTYTVSHDLRSPLITVQGFIEMLREDLERNEKEKVESDLKFIENGTAKLEHLLNDTLRLSRIGRMVNPPEDVPFGELVQEAQVQTGAQIKSSGVEISVAEDFPAVHVDRMRIVEVLVNLMTNSINYMGEQPHPKIDIGYRVDDEETVFFVRDNGIGIDKSQHEKVFELFYTVDKSGKGTGAGLTIVKRIIEVHNGKVWIESEKGKGCTVCFTLPVA